MKTQKQRIVAIDYFRGICILLVLLSHSSYFSMPFAYLSGIGHLWTSAAEMFFILSGITFGIVRGPNITDEFKSVLKKTYRRAALIYLLNAALALYAIVLGYFLISKGLYVYSTEALPSQSGIPLLLNILILRSPFGWADFLIYYSVFLLIAPFCLYGLKTRFWPAITLTSALIFMMQNPNLPYSNFAIWQLYFIMGLTIARFRAPIIRRVSSWSRSVRIVSYRAISLVAMLVLGVSILTSFNIFPLVNRLAVSGWLPMKIRGAYAHLLSYQPSISSLLQDNRSGILRPLVSLLVLGAAYCFYQKHKEFLLRYTGRWVNPLGRNTLWIYVAQALIIPLIAALPLHYGGIAIDALALWILLYMSWLVTRRKSINNYIANYYSNLKLSYKESKFSYLQRYEDG